MGDELICPEEDCRTRLVPKRRGNFTIYPEGYRPSPADYARAKERQDDIVAWECTMHGEIALDDPDVVAQQGSQ